MSEGLGLGGGEQPAPGDGQRAPRRWVPVVLIATIAVIGLVLSTRTPPPEPVELIPVAVDGDDPPGDLPTVELAISDRSGLRVVALPGGDETWLGRTTLDGAPLVAAPSGALVGSSATTFYPWDGTRPVRIGAGRPIALAGEGRVWLLDWQGSSLLTASLTTFDGEVLAETDLGRQGIGGVFAALFGPAHHPLLVSGRSVLQLDDDGSTSLVTSGQLVATGVNHIAARRCGSEGSCASTIIDVESGAERSLSDDAVAGVRPSSSVLSPDGRWLAVAERGSSERFRVIDLDSGGDTRVATAANLPGPGSLSWSADSRWVFVAGPGTVTAYDVAGQRAHVLDVQAGPHVRVAVIDR